MVTLGDSDDLRVGQWVLAIGSPFGFEYTATQGIVSAVSRSLQGDSYVPFIQTDAAVNPGNSGGPLFDTEGNVIGVNSQIYTRSGGYMGLSFAIPVNVVKNVTLQLKENGYASYGWLGVTIQDMDKALSESFGLDRPRGALVSQVTPDSPADDAGLQAGDVILAFGEKPVESSASLPPLVGATRPGSTAMVEIVRGGKNIDLSVTVRELQRDGVIKKTSATPEPETPDGASSVLGLQLSELGADEREQLSVDNGLLAKGVDSDGPAGSAGIRPGDVIVSLNQIAIESSAQLDEVVEELPRGESVPVLVVRDARPYFIAVTIPRA